MSNMTAKNEEDLWGPVEIKDSGKTWAEKTCVERIKTMVVIVTKVAVLLALLYLFVCSIGLLSDAFRLLGGKAAGEAFSRNEILNNPLADLMIGVLATVLLQSSSTSTSIVVSMVAVGLIPVKAAIFMIMGANIGTSITNTIVSLGQVGDRDQFRRAFAGATVHDFFNWLTVIVILPIEWISSSVWTHCFHDPNVAGGFICSGCGILCQMTAAMVSGLENKEGTYEKTELLKVITSPFQKKVIQLDKKVITKIAKGEMDSSESIMKYCSKEVQQVDAFKPISCNYTLGANNESFIASTDDCWVNINQVEEPYSCDYLFESKAGVWSDTEIGVCLLFMALTLLMVCLIAIVRLLHSLLRGQLAKIIQRFINSDLPGVFKYFTGPLAIILGMGFTMLLQSSSIFTSAITPLVGAGVLKLDRMYPLTLGANIGTTFTAILAALASSDLQLTLHVALCHLFFNIFGILIWYPIPFMRRVPIKLAKMLGTKTSKHRWFAIAYLLLVFLAIPGAIFGLSLASWIAVVCVVVPLLIFFITIIVINVLQTKKPEGLPERLRTWDFLPTPLHSLKPYDTWCTCGEEEDYEADVIVVEGDNGHAVNKAHKMPEIVNKGFVPEDGYTDVNGISVTSH